MEAQIKPILVVKLPTLISKYYFQKAEDVIKRLSTDTDNQYHILLVNNFDKNELNIQFEVLSIDKDVKPLNIEELQKIILEDYNG